MRVVVGAVVLAALAVASDARAGDAPRAIDVIENDLVADDPAVRAKAAAELTDRFPDGAVAVLMLVELLDDESPEVVKAAAKSIDAMAVSAAGVLADYLADDARWRPDSWLPRICGPMSGSPPGLNPDSAFRFKDADAADEFVAAALFPERRYVPRLLHAARTEGTTRTLASAALAMAGVVLAEDEHELPSPASRARSQAATKAVALLKARDGVKSWAGASLLERLRCLDESVVAELIAALSSPKIPQSKNANVWELQASRNCSIRALGAIGPAAARCAPTVLADLGDDALIFGPGRPVRALLRMGKEADVVAAIKTNPRFRVAICMELARHRRAASVVVPALVAELKLGSFEGHDSPLLELADYGPAAVDALPELRRRAFGATQSDKPTEYEGRLRYVEAILRITPDDDEAIRFLCSVPPEAKRNATGILAGYAAPVPAVVENVVGLLHRQTSVSVRDDDLVEGIARFGPKAAAAVDDLLTRLVAAGARDFDWRQVLAGALGRIGPDATAAVPALTALRNNGDETIRVPAAQALRRIRAKK